jgi:rubrerythrin
MRPLHELLLSEIRAERHRLSRRGLLTTSATLAGGAALATSLAAGPSPVSIRHVAAVQVMTSMDVLNYALSLEHLAYAFYRDGADFYAFGDDGHGASIDDNLAAIRDHELAHVKALTRAITDLGGEPVAEVPYNFGDAYNDPATFLATAMALENIGVSAYDGAGQYIDDPDLLTMTGSIVAVEARHASYLNLLNGHIPFPDAFEQPLDRDEVLGIVGPFITVER